MTPRFSVAKDKLKFVLLEGIHASALDVLRSDGYTQIVSSPKALAGDELIEAIGDAHFLGIRSRTLLTTVSNRLFCNGDNTTVTVSPS